MIEIEKLVYAYPDGPRILAGIDLRIDEGTYVGIVGANGSGKSTFTKQLNALLLPTEGRVLVDGQATAEFPSEARQRVGMVLQNPENQIVGSVVEDDVAFGPENLMLADAELAVRVGEALARVGLAELKGRAADTLSGGQKQRLAIAGILAMRPRYVVVDEPTSMLDPVGREEVQACLKDLNRQGITVLHVTHLLEELAEAGRILAFEAGKVVFDGVPEALFRDAKLLHRLRLEPPPPVALALALETRVGIEARAPWTLDQALEALGAGEPGGAPGAPVPGGAAREGGGGAPASPAAALVEARGLDVEYGTGGPIVLKALDRVDFRVAPGELVGLVGATGSGKSTLVQVLAGLLKPTGGSLEYGADVDPTALYRSLGIVFQQPEDQLFEVSVFEDVAYGPRQLGIGDEEVKARVHRALAALGMDREDLLTRSPFDLSGGEKRRVAIAGILAMEPKVLVFDEPTAGLDAEARRRLLHTLRELHEKRGQTVVVVSHDMDLLASLASRMVVLERGRVLADGGPAQVFAAPEALSRAGLRPPYPVRLLAGLRRAGWDVALDLFEPDAAARAVAAARPGGQGRTVSKGKP